MYSFLIFLCLSSSMLMAQTADPEKLIDYELVASYTKNDLEKAWAEVGVPKSIIPIRYAVDVYEVVYKTAWHDGSEIKASGLYYVPQMPDSDKVGGLPVMCYHHGTKIKKKRPIHLSGQQAICIGFATDGYLVARPDYVGLGKGERKHLYHHVPTQAGATMDFLRAVKAMNTDLGVEQNDFLFSTGYSQGGHASMSFHKVAEEQYAEEFKLTASAPMSGAYDLAGAQESTMFEPYSHPGYLPYLFFSFQEVYQLYDDVKSILKAPYDTILPPLYDGEHSMRYINRLIPNVPKEVIHPEVIQAYLDNDDFPFKKALRENSVHDWKPKAPILLCYCEADEQVSYKNSLVAAERMKANGAKHIRLKHVSKHLGHNDCALFAVMHVKMYFDSFLKGSQYGRMGPVGNRFILGIGKGIMNKRVKKRRREQAKAANAAEETSN